MTVEWVDLDPDTYAVVTTDESGQVTVTTHAR